jgi:hypothetical protein
MLQSADDLGKLSLLENASIGTYPQLNASANLKQLRINLDAKPNAKFKPTVFLKIPRTTVSILGSDVTGRSQGTYQNPSTSSERFCFHLFTKLLLPQLWGISTTARPGPKKD